MKYRVYVTYPVSQVVEVEADSIDSAIDAGVDEVDLPNISNKFDEDGEMQVICVYDEQGREVWRDGSEIELDEDGSSGDGEK